MVKIIELSDDIFKEYLRLRYSPSAVRQYMFAYNSYSNELTSLYLFNCQKIECKNYKTTLNLNRIQEHIQKYH